MQESSILTSEGVFLFITLIVTIIFHHWKQAQSKAWADSEARAHD